MNTIQNDFDKAFNGATIERVYTGNLVIGKRDSSPTGKKYVVTHYMKQDGKYSFYWSTYDIETFCEACDIAEEKL
jgi:hypothetical protein